MSAARPLPAAADHPDHARHPSPASSRPRPHPLPDRAWSLACAGHRSPAIAQQLGVPERTVRAWLAATRRELSAQLAAERADELLRAVEHLRQISLAAWDAYEASQQRDAAILAGQHDFLRAPPPACAGAAVHRPYPARSAHPTCCPCCPRCPCCPGCPGCPC